MARVRIKSGSWGWGGRLWARGEYEIPDDDPVLEAMRRSPQCVEVLEGYDPSQPAAGPEPEVAETGPLTGADLDKGGRRKGTKRR